MRQQLTTLNASGFISSLATLIFILSLVGCGDQMGGVTPGRRSDNSSLINAKAEDVLFDTTATGLHSPNVQNALDATIAKLKTAENHLQSLTSSGCPTGMVLIAGIKSCVDENFLVSGATSSFSFASAHSTCVAAGKRLCSGDELQQACKQNLFTPTSAPAWEWTNNLMATDAAALVEIGGTPGGNYSCMNRIATDSIADGSLRRGRCCL